MIPYILIAILAAALVYEKIARHKEIEKYYWDIRKNHYSKLETDIKKQVTDLQSDITGALDKVKTDLEAIQGLLDKAEIVELIEQQKQTLEQSEKVMEGISNILSYEGKPRKKGDS